MMYKVGRPPQQEPGAMLMYIHNGSKDVHYVECRKYRCEQCIGQQSALYRACPVCGAEIIRPISYECGCGSIISACGWPADPVVTAFIPSSWFDDSVNEDTI